LLELDPTITAAEFEASAEQLKINRLEQARLEAVAKALKLDLAEPGRHPLIGG